MDASRPDDVEILMARIAQLEGTIQALAAAHRQLAAQVQQQRAASWLDRQMRPMPHTNLPRRPM